MTYQEKEFTPIPNTKYYFICKDTTEVLSIRHKTPLILKQCPIKAGYLKVTLFDLNDQRFDAFIHRIMAELFLPGPVGTMVNHIDGNKTNNLIDNLEWSNAKHNTQHAVKIGLLTNDHFKKEIHQYTLKGNYITSFNSVADASNYLGTNIAPNITKHIAGERPHVLGYQWSFDFTESLPDSGVSLLKDLTVINLDTKEKIIFNGRGALKKAAEIVGLTNSALVCRFKSTNITYVNQFKLIKTYYD